MPGLAGVVTVPDFVFQYPPAEPGETVLGCCPTGYRCTVDTQLHQTCYYDAVSTSFQTGICDGDTLTGSSYVVVSGLQTARLLAPLFQLNLQPSDLGLTVATASATQATGLSTGAIAAIATVVPVVVLALLAGLAAWLWRRRRQR